MQIPEKLAAALAAADDAYFIGLSNKGTLNRARKDLAALSGPETCMEGEGVRIKMGEVTCLIKAPLGESTCTCPSSAMCRHRLAAMLLLKENTGAAEPPKPVFEELKQYPAEKIVNTLGTKRLDAALFRFESGSGPAIRESTVIEVEMPWHPATVRLLEPLEHSTCTCRSRSLCIHKAEAILHWQLKEKILTPDPLRVQRAEHDLNLEAVREVCRSVRQTLTAQLTTGLSRIPAGVCESVERMAALCHTAGLADLERALRSLHGEYAAYFGRSATFRDWALLEKLSRAYRLAAALEKGDSALVSRLAGTFRDEYESAGHLRLYLLGLRAFSGRSGYAGTVYYFWDRSAERFYTFNHIRPTFYEGAGRSRRSAAAPWGLPCTLQQAWNCSMDLTGAKVSRTGNLSATEQCSAMLLARSKPGAVIQRKWIEKDFLRLLMQNSDSNLPEIRRLALVQPRACIPVDYDRVRQVFSMQLYDDAGRDLWLEVSYKKEEAAVVNMLERLSASVKRDPALCPVFFGIIYRDEDRLKLYPIEYFTDWEG